MARRHPSTTAPALPHSILACAVQGLLWATACAAGSASAQTSLPTGTTSAPADARKAYQIPAGALDLALADFAAAAGVSITVPPALVQGKTSGGLQGNYAVRDGFARLLADSGLEAGGGTGGVFVLRPATAAADAGAGLTLAPVVVTATAERSSVTGGTGAYTAGPSATATGLNLSLRDTPQTITVVTRQQMDDQGSTSVSDVMRSASGITAQNYDSERWSFATRGFSMTNFQYDGIAKVYDGVYDWGATNSDMTMYDRVEIVKGATGLMSGAGDPSAAVNMVRKRPTDKFAGSVTASAGSWNNGRAEVDLSGPINESGSLRGRFVGAYQDRESFLDHYRQKKSVAYGVVEADLARGTLLTVGVDYQEVDPRGSTWTGFPIFNSDGSRTDWSRSFNPATTWSKRQMETCNVFATLDHQLAEDWKLKLTVNNQRSKHHSLLGSASGGNPDPVTGEGMYFFMGDFAGNRTQNTLNASVTGKYELMGRKHELMLGAMWTDTQTDGPWSESLYPAVPGSIFGWQGVYPQPEFVQTASYTARNRQSGVYGATRLRPTDALSVILGARVSRVEGSDNRVYFDGVTSALSSSLRETGVITPYAGVVYDLDETYSVYGSYTSIFSPQESRDVNRQFLAPVKGNSVEAGIKGEYLDGRVNASLAVFQIKQDNVAEYVDFVDGESVYRAVKGVTSRGIEAELSGQITDGWNLQLGYAYAHVRNAQGERVYGSTLMASQPEHIARVSTSYRLPGNWNQLTVGGSLSWQSAFYGKVWNPVAADYAVITQKGYALASLMARYQFNKNLSASLHINNVFDKKYYTGIGLFETGFYGEPRSATLAVRYQF